MMDKAQLETKNWQIAHTWADGLGLEFSGVALGDLTTYSLLSVLGRIQITSEEKKAAADDK